MPKLSEDQQHQRRKNILDAAENCFASGGFHSTSMQDICKAAGISAGALYVYFASKEALIAGLAERDRAQILANVARLAEAPDLAAGLRVLLQTSITEQPAHKVKLWLEIGAEAARNPGMARIFNDCDGAIRGAIQNTLRRAEAEGRIAPTIPVERIVAVMGIIADGLIWRRAIAPDFDINLATTDIVSLIGALVGARDPLAPPLNEAAQ